jgi:hypothetical protein
MSVEDFSEDDVRYLYEPSFTWNWVHLSETLDFNKVIVKCIGLPWDHNALSRNKTVSYKDVATYPDINWNYNIMCLDSDVKEWNASNTIKKFWKRCVTDPAYVMCKKILFEDLNSIQGMLPGRVSIQDI